jgi:hypothetical protein
MKALKNLVKCENSELIYQKIERLILHKEESNRVIKLVKSKLKISKKATLNEMECMLL